MSPLLLRALTPDLWAIEAPLIWSQLGRTIIVPKGFITDLASIPRALWSLPLTDPNGPSRRPACLHDWCYAGLREEGKDFADDLLREACECEGMSYLGASTYYYAVHWFGQRSWDDDGRTLVERDFVTKADYDTWRATKSSVSV